MISLKVGSLVALSIVMVYGLTWVTWLQIVNRMEEVEEDD